MSGRISLYRMRAEEARTIAQQIKEPFARRSFEHVAIAFDEMADHLGQLLLTQMQTRRRVQLTD
jgi:hypothetical protein